MHTNDDDPWRNTAKIFAIAIMGLYSILIIAQVARGVPFKPTPWDIIIIALIILVWNAEWRGQ